MFVDNDRNGVRGDPVAEPGLAGVTVALLDSNNTLIASTTTTASGLYSFTGLTPGIPYSVSFVTPTGYVLSPANAGGDDEVDSDVDPLTGRTTQTYSLTAGQTLTTVDAGVYLPAAPPTASIGDYVFFDDDADGKQGSPGETGVSGVTVRLYREGITAPVSTTTTGSDGKYLFTNLTTGVGYYVVFDTTGLSARQLTLTTANQGADSTDSDADAATGRTGIYRLTAGEVNRTVDAGLKSTCPTKYSLVVSGENSVCTGDSLQLTASTLVRGAKVYWYLTAVGGRPFATLDPDQPVTVKPTTTTTYYVEAGTVDGCRSPRRSVTVTVTTVPTPVYAGNIRNTCPATTVDLTRVRAQNSSAGLTYEWYTSAVRSTATRITNLTYVGAGTVYLFARSTTGCYSNPAALTVEIVDCNCANVAGVNVGPGVTACAGELVPLRAVLTGSATGITWSSNGTGRFTNSSSLTPSYNPSAADIARGSVLLTATTNDPDGPGGSCNAGTGAVLVTISTCSTASSADLAVQKQIVTPGTYSVGQRITYSITAANNGPLSGTGVSVKDLLPATLTYVGSTPAGEYAPGTGIWTVGTLAKGTTRNLLIEATINTAGSIRNTAVIGGPNNDLKLTQNDTSSVLISTGQCDTKPPFLTCAISQLCQGGATTMNATGCEGGIIKWSDGQSGLTVSVSPAVTTIYTANCVLGCTSAASNPITVWVLNPKTPVITASAGSICPGTSVTLTASGCEGGTIMWSEGGQTGASIVVSPRGKTTYTAQCRIGSCLSNPSLKTIDVTTNLPAPTIVCSTSIVCPGETVTLTVEGCVGTPVWNTTSQTTTSIIVTSTVGNNEYSVYCKSGSCVSKLSLTYTIAVAAPATPTVTASTDSVCVNGLVSLTATGCIGTVIWNATDKTGASLTGAVISVYPDANISYYALCRFRTCLGEPSNAVPITIVVSSAPIVRSNKSLMCSGDKATLTAEGCSGTVTWYGVNRMGASIDIYPAETKEYYATCQQGTCESEPSNKVRITVNTSGTAPTIAASTTAVCSGGLVSLTATACAGNVIWSDGQTGAVATVRPTPTNNEFYAICRIGTQCGSGKSNVIKVAVAPLPMPTVTCSTEIICPGEKVTLTVKNCSGTPNWSTGETANMIIVTPAVTTAYTVYCQNSGGCRSDESAPYTITVTPALPPAITASATAVAPGGTVSLTATGCAGEVIWNANDINGNNKGSVMVVRPEGAQSYYARCRFRECLSDPSRTILVNGSANAGDCSTLAGTLKPVSATVAATTGQSVVIAATPDKASVQPPDYTTVYVLTKGTGLVVQQTGPRPSFTVPATAAQYAIHTLIYNGNPTSPNYFDITDAKLGISTVANIVSLIDSRRVCADIDVAGARIMVGRTPVVEPPVAEPPVAGPPVVSVSSQTVCAGTTVTFTANGCVGGVINWSDGSTGLSITKTVNADLQLTVTCTRNGVVSAASPSATVTVTPKPEQPQAIDRTNACPSTTVNLATGVTSRLSTTGGVFEYYTNATLGADSKVADPAAAGAGTYYAVEKSANGCYSLPARILVTITPCGVAAACDGTNPATANAGSDTGICAAKTYQLSGQMGGGGKTARWTTSGSGTFDNPLATNAIYTASAQDVSAGKVSLTLSVSTANAACPVAKDDMVLTVGGSNVSPLVTVQGTTNVCIGDSVTLQAPAGAGYLWTNRATTQRIVVKTGGTCSVQLIDANGCSLLKSADVTVNVTNCTPTDTATTDVSITKTVSKPTVAMGDVITYTLNVRNLSTRRATNVDVRDVLPTGLEWVPVSGTGYTVSGKTITQRIDTLRANQSVSIVFAARVTAAGNITNRAVIAYLDQRDTNTGNNQSEVTVSNSNASPIPAPTPVPGPVGKPGLIGLAKTVAGTPVVPGDSLVRVSYNFVLTNYGTDTLRNVRVTDDLAYAFSPNTVVSAVVTTQTTGTNLVIDRAFTGRDANTVLFSSASYMAPGSPQRFTLDVTVRRIAGDTTRTFRNIASVTAQNSVTALYDLSTDGTDPDGDGNPTNNTGFSRFTLSASQTTGPKPGGLIGVAKSVGTPVLVEEGVFDVLYTITVRNMGTVALRKVQVTDNLSQTFRNGALIVSNRIAVRTNAGFAVDAAYTGQGLITRMLVDSLSSLPVGASNSLTFTVRVNVKNADSLTFYNTARATALADGEPVEDVSTSGMNADPDNDLDPRNNSTPTPVTLRNLLSPYIGVAMAVRDTARQANGSFNVTYQIVLRNYGRDLLTNVSLTDTLSRVFNAAVGASYSVVKVPITTSTGSVLKLNPAFNGATDMRIVLGDNGSTLAVGKMDTVLVTLNVLTDGRTTTFMNQAYAAAKAGTQTVADVSTNGLNPDLNGNNNPTDRNEREATPLNLPSTSLALFIPQGFSPNGDGINDLFVIRGAGSLTISLDVCNRWGHLVYRNNDYRNDWDSRPNTGITLGSNASGLPDGTYYYVIKMSDGRNFVRYMTINR